MCLRVLVVEMHTRLQVGEELHDLLADMHSLETSQVSSAGHDSVSNGAREKSARGANFAAVQAAAVLQDEGCCNEMHGDVHVNDDIEDCSEEAGAGGSQHEWKAVYHSVMEELKVSQELRQINQRIASLESIQGQGSDVQEESGWTQFDDSPGLDITDTAHNDMSLQDLANSNSTVEANLPDEMAKQHGNEVEEEEDDDSETEELKREIALLQEQNVVSQPILQGTTVASRRVQLLRTGPPAPQDGQVSLFLVDKDGCLCRLSGSQSI